MKLPHTYLGADGQTYEIIAARPLRRWPGWREAGRILAGGAASGLANCLAVLGGLFAAIWVAVACLAAGPIGWLIAIVAVPGAFFVGMALGVLGGFAALALSIILILAKL
jgi:hypothetical protein